MSEHDSKSGVLTFILFWIGVAALILISVWPSFAQAPAGLPSVGPGSSFNATIESYFFGDYPVTASSLTGCSTGGTPVITGNQKQLLVTAGTTASTTCTITWPIVRSSAPVCVITGHTAAAAQPFITVNSTTTLTWTYTSAASAVWEVICMGPR